MPIGPELPTLEDLCAAELRSLVVSLRGTVAQLEAKVAALSEEIARLKRLKGRPNLKPSGMEKGTDAPPASGSSSAGELHPCALTEPYVKLSFHTALLAPDRPCCPL